MLLCGAGQIWDEAMWLVCEDFVPGQHHCTRKIWATFLDVAWVTGYMVYIQHTIHRLSSISCLQSHFHNPNHMQYACKDKHSKIVDEGDPDGFVQSI